MVTEVNRLVQHGGHSHELPASTEYWSGGKVWTIWTARMGGGISQSQCQNANSQKRFILRGKFQTLLWDYRQGVQSPWYAGSSQSGMSIFFDCSVKARSTFLEIIGSHAWVSVTSWKHLALAGISGAGNSIGKPWDKASDCNLIFCMVHFKWRGGQGEWCQVQCTHKQDQPRWKGGIPAFNAWQQRA